MKMSCVCVWLTEREQEDLNDALNCYMAHALSLNTTQNMLRMLSRTLNSAYS
jgi:hypothetical protein